MGPSQQLLQTYLVNSFAASLLVSLGNGWIVLAKVVPTLPRKALRQDCPAGDLSIDWQKADAIGSSHGHHNQKHCDPAPDTPHRLKRQDTSNLIGLEKP
jgi:hypothetical protein